MGKRVEGRREMDLVPRAALGGGGMGRRLPKGPWLMALIPKPSGRMVASGDCQGKCIASTPGSLPYCPRFLLLPIPILRPF